MLDLCHATRFLPRLWEVNLLIEPAPDCSIWVSSSRCSGAGGTRARCDASRRSCNGPRVGGASGPTGAKGHDRFAQDSAHQETRGAGVETPGCSTQAYH